MKPLAVLTTLSIACLAGAQYPGSKAVPGEWKKGFDSITETKGRSILGKLAGPEFRGRSPLNGDFNLAAGWLASRLEADGIQPAGDDGTYFHRFTVWDTTPIPEVTVLRSEDGKLTVPFGPHFSILSNSQTTWQLPKLAFVHVPKAADWKSLDLSKLKDRWVFLSTEAAANGDFRKRLNGTDGQAKPEHLAVYVSNERSDDQKVTPTKTRSVMGYPDPRRPQVFGFSVSAKTIYQLAAKAGATSFGNPDSKSATVETSDMPFFIDVKVTSTEFPMVNVIGKIPGSDPTLKNEAIVIGSHLDHMGPGRNGTLFGADDNASGCTANLMIGEALLANAVKPKRTVFCCFWSSEELGLLGSYAFVQRPAIGLKNIAAYINMDMVGRNENDPRFKEKSEDNLRTVYPSGVAFNSPEFLKVLFAQNQYVGLVLKPDVEDRIMRSDSGSFAWKEIPTVKVFTGDHEDYHKATDTVEKVNYEKMTNIAKWLYLTVQELASARPRPTWTASPFKPLPWPDPRTKH